MNATERKDDLVSPQRAKREVPSSSLSNVCTIVGGELVPLSQAEARMKALGFSDEEIKLHLSKIGTKEERHKSAAPKASSFEDDLRTAYKELGGISYLKSIAINRPDVFLKVLAKGIGI